jgi:hypothetical protein
MPWNVVARTGEVRFCTVHPNRPTNPHTVGRDFPCVKVSLPVSFQFASHVVRGEVIISIILPLSRISSITA